MTREDEEGLAECGGRLPPFDFAQGRLSRLRRLLAMTKMGAVCGLGGDCHVGPSALLAMTEMGEEKVCGMRWETIGSG
jgi:hypothetical protein